MTLLIFTLILVFTDVSVSQVHIIGPRNCYTCDGHAHAFPDCLHTPHVCHDNEACSITYGNGEVHMQCQKDNDCLRDFDHAIGQCDGGGQEIHPGVCKACCTTDDCLNKAIAVLTIDYNTGLFCPGECSTLDWATCIRGGTHCLHGQYCELTITDHHVTKGTCKLPHDLQKCTDDTTKQPCDIVHLEPTHGPHCVWGCCTTQDCLISHFGVAIASISTIGQPATLVPPTTPSITAHDPPVKCVTCFDAECNTTLPLVDCPGGFCMQSVYYLANGATYLEKSCASRATCTQDWSLVSDAIKTQCRNAQTSPLTYSPARPLICHYCCQGEGCNTGQIQLSSPNI